MGTLQRIKQYIDYKGITNKEFEENVGFSNGAFASQLKRNRTIGVDKLENILSFYSEINPEWLLTGEGEMLKQPQSCTNIKETLPINNNETELLRKQIALLEENKQLYQEIGQLHQKIEELHKRIQTLERENFANQKCSQDRMVG